MNARPFHKVPAPGTISLHSHFPVALFLSVIFLSCAGQVPPAGGPVDTVPPLIIRTAPDSNAVRVEPHSIELEFSKYVDRRSVEESIFISPYVGELEFEWSGREVRASFSQPLRRNTTYVVNVGTDVADLRAGNHMAAGFTLAFSTGDSIDMGFVTGRVYDEKPEGVMIFAYALDQIDRDTLNPWHAKPDYIMQTGKGGLWKLSNIAFGTYRIYAIRDEYKNLLYDRGIDAYGVSDRDISVDVAHPRIGNVNFRLTREDTVKPFLSSVRVVDRTRLLVRFSEGLDTLSFPQSTISIIDTSSHTPVQPLLWWLTRSSPNTAGVLLATALDSGSAYRFRVGNAMDAAGNLIDTMHAWADFSGTNRPDTLRTGILTPGLRDSVRGFWIEQPVEIDFSRPVLHEPLARAVMLLDSAKKPVELDARWMNATDLILVPHNSLLSSAWYRLKIVMDSVQGYYGPRFHDSTFVLSFQTIDMRTTGVIAGTVIDRRAGSPPGVYYLTASSIDLSPPRKRRMRIDGPGSFTLNRLVEGKYVLDVFRDQVTSGSFTYGSVFPYVAAERFAVYPDTIKVRARWNVEGVQIILP